MKPQELTIGGELFNEFRNNFDIGMRILINRMISTRISKGTVSAKVSIELKECVNDAGEIVRMPEINYSIGMGMSEKDSMKGNMQRGLIMKNNGNGKLLIGSSQIDIDELIKDEEEQRDDYFR